MHVFVTGGSGWVGRHLLPLLASSGHTVTALSRSESSDSALRAIIPEANVVRGDLTTLDVLTSTARSADAVIHLAFIHDFASATHDFMANINTDGEAVKALAAGLAPGKIFINTSGTLGGAKEGRPYLESDAGPAVRPDYYDHLTSLGLIPIVIRLAPMVHGMGDKGFATGLIATAQATGVSGYIGDGQTRWTGVHVKDAAKLYHLALGKGIAGHYHAAETEGHSIKDIATAIGTRLGLPVKSIPQEDAAAQWTPFLSGILALDSPVSSTVTRERLGWSPEQPSLIDDLRTSETYFASSAKSVA